MKESNYVNLGQCSTKKEVVYLHQGIFEKNGYTVLTPSCGGEVQEVNFTEVNPIGIFLTSFLFIICFVVWINRNN